MFKFLNLAVLFFGFSLLVCSFSYAGQFKRGKYFGGIQMEGSPTQVAVVLDTFAVTAPETPEFPQVDAMLRLSPGGFFSSEYTSYQFHNFSYNWQKGIVYLDDPKMDLTATLEATNNDSITILEGPVVFRPSLRKGHMRVQMDEDEPSPTGPVGFNLPFLPSLQGEYKGKCDNKTAALQVETGRETSLSRMSTTGLDHYVVTGRIGYRDNTLCSIPGGVPRPAICSHRFYTGADYRFLDNSLLLQGPRTALDCTTSGSDLSCRQQILGKSEVCSFKKAATQTTKPVVYPRRFFMKVSPEQKKTLPFPKPPLSTDLVNALNGAYYGFLHHENRDQYQLIQMNVSASSTTIHPHIPERVYITVSLSAHFGSSWEGRSLYGQEFLRKEFYMVPFYRLESEGSDVFFVVDEWKVGYLRGVWYSKEYGRVGTFEFIKETPPQVPANITIIPSIDGAYEGPTDRDPETDFFWWLKAFLPGQIPREKRNTAYIQGEYEFKSGILTGRAFEGASLDMYTGALSFLVPEGAYANLITGQIPKPDTLRLIWPGASIYSVPMTDYAPYTYRKTEKTGKED